MKQSNLALFTIVTTVYFCGCAPISSHYSEGKLLVGKPAQEFRYSIVESKPGSKIDSTNQGEVKLLMVNLIYDGGPRKHYLKIFKKDTLIKECDDNQEKILSRIKENGYNPEQNIFPIFGPENLGLNRISPISDSPGEITDKKNEDYEMGYEINCEIEYKMDTLFVDSYDSKGLVSKYLIDPSLK